MARTLWVVVVASGLLGGVAGGLVVHQIEIKPPKASAKAEPAKTGNDPDDGQLADRVDALERTVAALRREQRARGAIAAYGAALRAETPDGGATRLPDRPALESAVRSVMDDLDAERQADRDARRAERRTAMAQRWTDAMTSKLALTGEQKKHVLQILQQMMTRPADTGADGGFVDFREQRRQARDTAEKQLAGVLDSRQMDQYKAMRDSGEIAFGGGRRGRGGGGN